MKLGAKVAVCQDGKWGRRVEGIVIATRKGHHIQVRFYHPENEETVTFWARKQPTIRRQRIGRQTGFIYSKRYAYFGGWADIDWFCPWYTVHKWSDTSD